MCMAPNLQEEDFMVKLTDTLKALYITHISVVEHDSSTTGIRYKLRVSFDTRFKSKDLGNTVLDTSNAIYRSLGFRYAQCPSVEVESRKPVFYYFFNDTDEAVRLGYKLSPALYKAYKRHEESMKAQGYPSFEPPYLYSKK